MVRISCRTIWLILAILAAGSAQSEERPNFLIILTDDMGFTDLGAFGGHDIETPNLDRLAHDGIRFTNFHGHARCAASRALLISGTGNHEAGFGAVVNIASFRGKRGYEQRLTNRVVTLPAILREGGYRTYITGKWDLKAQPSRRGFDKSMVILRGGAGHYQAINPWVRYSRNGEAVAEQGEPTYSTTLFTDALIEFLEEDKASDKPYFALFAPAAPHWPLHFPPGMQDTYEGSYADGYEVLRERRIKGAAAAGVLPEGADPVDYESHAPRWQSLSEEEKAINSRVMEIYASMTTHLDAEVGRLLDKLRDIGALDNTLVIFINDNGAEGGPIFRPPQTDVAASKIDNSLENLGAGNSWAHMGQGWAEAVNAPFRDTKGSVYEGALRVAAFANWAGANHPESINRQHLNNMDLMPTLLELAGMTHPAPRFDDRDVLPTRGKSFAGILRGDNGAVHEPGEAIVLSTAGRHFLYRGNLKLLKELGSNWELYDLDGEMYLRQERNGVLLGVYEQNSTPWSVEGTPWNYGASDLLEERLDDISDALAKGFERFPSVAEAGIRRVVNGPFTFAPDGNPLVGPVRGVQNYWSCCGVMAGFSQGSGVALALSQWMINGEPEGDVFAMDVNRFGSYASSAYAVEKGKEFYENRFYLLCPNDEWPAARPNKTSVFYDRLQRANAVFGESFGLEVPLWFAPEGMAPEEAPSFRRSNSHDPVGEECRAVRGGVGILDGSSFAKYEVSGPDAVAWMDYLFASRLPEIGRIRMGPLLLPSGNMKGDLTVMRLAQDQFMIIGSGYLQEFHMLWFEQHVGDKDVRIVNRSDEMTTIAIAGPESRALMQTVASGDFDTQSMPFMSVRSMDVGLAPCEVARISFTGELGYEIYVPSAYAASVYDGLTKAGKRFGIRPFGIRALVSMGMEKSFGIWSREFTPDYTPVMCGMDRWVDYGKSEFIGRDAALAVRGTEPEHKLAALEIDAGEADAWGYEPIWCGDEYAGYVTSGAYGHTVGKSLALAYVKAPFLGEASVEFMTHLVDGGRPTRVLPEPPYDPRASKMRE